MYLEIDNKLLEFFERGLFMLICVLEDDYDSGRWIIGGKSEFGRFVMRFFLRLFRWKVIVFWIRVEVKDIEKI